LSLNILVTPIRAVQADQHHLNLLVKVHSILSASFMGGLQTLNLLVYDTTGSIELRLPWKEESAEKIRHGHTVLQIENAACLAEERDSPKVYIVVPRRSKHVKV